MSQDFEAKQVTYNRNWYWILLEPLHYCLCQNCSNGYAADRYC